MNTQQKYEGMTDSAMTENQPIEVDTNLYETQKALTDLVLSFTAKNSPSVALYRMLMVSPPFELADKKNKSHVDTINRLSGFVSDLLLQGISILQMESNYVAQNEPTATDIANFYEARTGLLSVIDQFMIYASPVKSVNALLEHWLTNASVDLSKPGNKRLLSQALKLVNFLVELRSNYEAVLVFSENGSCIK